MTPEHNPPPPTPQGQTFSTKSLPPPGGAGTPVGGPPAPTETVYPGAEAAPCPPRLRVADYEVLGELGRGGMGVVYRARHLTLGHQVALKMILAADHAGPDARARFLLEAAAVARLHHPGIVPIHDFGEHQGQPFFSLEFLPGGSLARRLGAGPLPAREAAALVEKLARAMAHAHAQGVVHRDLKPANVLLTADGEPKVTDFGLAKRVGADDGLSRTGSVLGTPAYIAPEQAEGRVRDIGPATDVYALGVILYECLTGQVPFKGTTLRETLELVSGREPPPPRRLVRALPRDLETVCLRCLEKDPKKRYAGAADLADDLARFLRGEPVAARPVGALARGWRWCRRNPAVASLLGAVAATLVLGAAVSASFAVRAAERAAFAQAKEGEAQAEAGEKERQRRAAEAQRERAERLAGEKERQRQLAEARKDQAEAETRRVRSALRTAQLLRAEVAGRDDPQAGFLLLHDEAVWPTEERDFAWGLYNRWCLREDPERPLWRATLKGHKGRVWAVCYKPGRPDPGQRRRGRGGPALGRRFRARARHARGARGRGLRRLLQPGRHGPGRRRRGRHGKALGRRRRARARRPWGAGGQGPLRQLQPGRQDPGLRRRGRHGDAVGRRRRARARPPEGTRGRRPLRPLQPGRRDTGQHRPGQGRPAVERRRDGARRPPGAHGPGSRRRLQPGRRARGQRQPGRDGQALGRGHRAGEDHLPGPDRQRLRRRLQPGRQACGQRQRGPDRSVVGHRRAEARHVPGAHGRGPCRQLQPGRRDAGQRLGGRYGEALGRGAAAPLVRPMTGRDAAASPSRFRNEPLAGHEPASW